MVRIEFLVLVLSASACASGRRGLPPASLPADVAGFWEGVSQSTMGTGVTAGDTRIERQAWRLTQQGHEISGAYVTELTLLSGDGRPYLCTGSPKVQVQVRVEVRGRIQSNEVEIQEVGQPRALGPCPVAMQSQRTIRASIRGDVMTLAFEGRPFVLQRRPNGQGKAAEAMLASTQPSADVSLSQPLPPLRNLGEDESRMADAEGYWLWENSTLTPEGDERSEREEWHLVQEGNKLSGHYDRWVRQVSNDGLPYRCSGNLDFRVGTRYEVTGEIKGDSISIFERRTAVLEGGPCDRGIRRLDAYQGRVNGEEIRLMLGTGVQVLRRSRPDVPSQKF